MSEADNLDLIKRQIDSINFHIWEIRSVPEENFDAFSKGFDALDKAKKINYAFGIALCNLNLGMGNFVIKNDIKLALKNVNEALEIFKSLNDSKWIANTHLTLAIIHNTSANPELALYNGLRGYNYFENNTDNSHDRTMANYILGTVYKDLKKYDEAEKFYQLGLSDSELNNGAWTGRIYNGLSNIYLHQEKYNLAIESCEKALILLKSQKNKMGEARSLMDIGSIYKKQKKYDIALNYFFEGLKIRESLHLDQFSLNSLLEISETYFEFEKYEEALEQNKLAEQVALKLKLDKKLKVVYNFQANIFKKLKRYELAVESYEKLVKISNEIHQKELDSKIVNLNTDLIKEKEAEIERLKNVELKLAYELIEEKNKNILESIRYASRIQNALLPSESYIEKKIPAKKK
ncbi:MAG: tetratricopeptide repeat protein [Bacteroidota bacterium]|nr:tetratricopeptide repeat protein [Bacteroidota bacterium]